MTSSYAHYHVILAETGRCHACDKTAIEIHANRLRCTLDPIVKFEALAAENERLKAHTQTLADGLLAEFSAYGPKDEGACQMALRVLRLLRAELVAERQAHAEMKRELAAVRRAHNTQADGETADIAAAEERAFVAGWLCRSAYAHRESLPADREYGLRCDLARYRTQQPLVTGGAGDRDDTWIDVPLSAPVGESAHAEKSKSLKQP